jgi:hypothetical protein
MKKISAATAHAIGKVENLYFIRFHTNRIAMRPVFRPGTSYFCIKGGLYRAIHTAKRKRSWIVPAPPETTIKLSEAHWQPVNLKLAICVLQLKVPLDFKYSLV